MNLAGGGEQPAHRRTLQQHRRVHRGGGSWSFSPVKSSEILQLGSAGPRSTEQIQTIPERSKQGQRGVLPNLKKCLEDAYCFLLSSFLGDSQPGTAFPSCQGVSATCLGSTAFAAEKSLCHSPFSFSRSSEALQHSVRLTHASEK